MPFGAVWQHSNGGVGVAIGVPVGVGVAIGLADGHEQIRVSQGISLKIGGGGVGAGVVTAPGAN